MLQSRNLHGGVWAFPSPNSQLSAAWVKVDQGGEISILQVRQAGREGAVANQMGSSRTHKRTGRHATQLIMGWGFHANVPIWTCNVMP